MEKYLPRLVFSLWLVVCRKTLSVSTTNQELPTTNQTGFAIIPLLILMLVGITAGTLLVQNGVNFLPKAADYDFYCDGNTVRSLVGYYAKDCTLDNNKICKETNETASCVDDPSKPTNTFETYCDGQTIRFRATNGAKDFCDIDYLCRVINGQATCVYSPTNLNNTHCVNNSIYNQSGKATENCSTGNNTGKICRNISLSEARCSPPRNIDDCKIYGANYTININTGLCVSSTAAQPVLPAAEQPAAASQKSACIQAQEAGAEIKSVCNLNGTKYCDNSTTLVTRAGGNCAASNQQADSRGCAYNYEKKNCAGNQKCNDPGDGKASCIPKDAPGPAAPTRAAIGGITDPIITSRQPAAGTEAASRPVSTGCENFKDSEGTLSIPCYKIGVFTPDELKATEAQAKVALERYTQYKRILSEVGGQIDNAIKAKAEEKIREAERLANACMAR